MDGWFNGEFVSSGASNNWQVGGGGRCLCNWQVCGGAGVGMAPVMSTWDGLVGRVCDKGVCGGGCAGRRTGFAQLNWRARSALGEEAMVEV